MFLFPLNFKGKFVIGRGINLFAAEIRNISRKSVQEKPVHVLVMQQKGLSCENVVTIGNR
jgi:hypothetical protein